MRPFCCNFLRYSFIYPISASNSLYNWYDLLLLISMFILPKFWDSRHRPRASYAELEIESKVSCTLGQYSTN